MAEFRWTDQALVEPLALMPAKGVIREVPEQPGALLYLDVDGPEGIWLDREQAEELVDWLATALQRTAPPQEGA